MDFTLNTYRRLIRSFQQAGYHLLRCKDYFLNEEMYASARFVILRHDVDTKPFSAYNMAIVEQQLGVESSYYFRSKEIYKNPGVLIKIMEMGHEVGYHYQDLSACRGNYEKAIGRFRSNLEALRRTVGNVDTVTMDGSPLSRFDNRDLWNRYSYKDLGIIAEPYLDLDFERIAYLTDTGRSWNRREYNRRDKPFGSQSTALLFSYRSTAEIIKAIENQNFPQQAMITMHSQRWSNSSPQWLLELLMQSMKNQIKRVVVNR
ncbi:MAG: hypothetical protein LWW91_02380 [Bacteroidales bacterium]|nr:hypothetical protein [Bacteroidales bacterium]